MANTLLPPPYKGQNDQFPLISIQSPYCERMENFNNLDGAVKVRKGNDCWVSSSVANYTTVGIVTYNTEIFLVMARSATDCRFYDITSGSLVLDHTSASYSGQLPVSFYYNGMLVFCDISTVTTYNGSAWTNSVFSFTSVSPYGGTEYKNRAYFIGFNSNSYAYSGIDAVTGATTTVDLSDQVSFIGSLYMIRPISLTQNLTPEAVLAFIFSSGEILVYRGSYPDSPNWGKIAQFKTAKPIQYNSFVEAKGDTIIFTESEIVSLRNLFISGYSKEKEEGIGSIIKNRWRQIILAYTTVQKRYVKGVYDEIKDRIVISLPNYVDPDTGLSVDNSFFQLIYDFSLQAWYEYYQTDSSLTTSVAVGAAYFNNLVYVAIQGNLTLTAAVAMVIDSSSTYVDDQLDGSGTLPIEYSLITAPLPISKFGANAITGVEAIVKSDLYPQTNYKFIADLGRQETEAQNLPDQGTSISKPMMNVGIQGAIAAQLQVYGSTVSASIGLEISALNVWYNSGDSGSR